MEAGDDVFDKGIATGEDSKFGVSSAVVFSSVNSLEKKIEERVLCMRMRDLERELKSEKILLVRRSAHVNLCEMKSHLSLLLYL